MANDECSTKSEAARALAAIADVERARADRLRAPGWYWQVVGGLFLVIEVSIILPSGWRIALLVLAALAGGAAIGAYQSTTGFHGSITAKNGWKLTLGFLLLVVLIAAVCWAIGAAAGAGRWMGAVSGVATYLAIVIIGPRLEKMVGGA